MGSRYVADSDRLKHKRISAGVRHKRPRVKVPGEDTANMRAVLIMLVMLYHSTMVYVGPDFVYHPQQQLVSVEDNPLMASVLGIASMLLFTPMMGLFFALSGYSFVYTLRKSTNYFVLIKKKFWRLLVPFIFIGLCWMMPIKLFIDLPSYRGIPLWKLLIKVFVTGSLSGHLWFVAVLFAMFAVFGISYHLFGLTSKADCGVLLLSILCYAVCSIIPIKVFFVDTFRLYYLFFVLGLLLHRYWDKIRKIVVNKCYWLLLLWYGIMVALDYYIVSGEFKTILTIILCMPFPIMLFALIPKRTNKFLILIGDNSMRLYLIHSPMVLFSFAYWLNINPVLMVMINFVGFGFLALGIGLLMEKLHLNFLLGERDCHARPVAENSAKSTSFISMRG